MTPDEERIRQEMVNNLLSMNEMMTPVIEAAEGFKKQLEDRGWSPTAAEQAATEMLLRMIRG